MLKTNCINKSISTTSKIFLNIKKYVCVCVYTIIYKQHIERKSPEKKLISCSTIKQV